MAEYERALPKLETLAAKTPTPQTKQMLACAQDNFGIALARNGEFSQAIQYQREALATLQQVAGPHSMEIKVSCSLIGIGFSTEAVCAPANNLLPGLFCFCTDVPEQS